MCMQIAMAQTRLHIMQSDLDHCFMFRRMCSIVVNIT